MVVIVTRARVARAAAVVLLAALASACASGGATKPPAGTLEPDKFLFDRGSDNLTKRRWIVAREYFRQLVDSYPQSPYRASAKLGVGDTYIGEHSAESFVLAINEFREFLNFYPTHEHADYAQFKLAMAHYYQMRAPMRDQTETRDAIRELETFVARYPNSPLMGEAKQHLREAKDRVDDWDFGVGVQYYRLKWYPGAINRLKPLIDKDPEYTNRDGVYFYLAESLEKVKRPAEALPYYERLVKEFEQSQYLDETKKRIAELKTTVPAAPGKAMPR
ncbi:MAG TPA: outer membrane protein assembly factor BamD [Vicinamibacterales bacterium]|jgi:outer membrane protein assembly factor BamD|nr:outer membrane protein assembly factor BamD [Vicinamibacterales bacterium]